MKTRGTVEIHQSASGHGFDVYEWDENHDAGHCVAFSVHRMDAIQIAQTTAQANGRAFIAEVRE